jgi:hypothetical protein
MILGRRKRLDWMNPAKVPSPVAMKQTKSAALVSIEDATTMTTLRWTRSLHWVSVRQGCRV